MNNIQTGQWGEHQAAAWFLRQGYNIYFPRSAGNEGIDFIAEKDGNVLKIQVKAGDNFNGKGLPKINFKTKGKNTFDFLFAIHTCGKARLYPVSKAPSGGTTFGNNIRPSRCPYEIDLFFKN